MTNHLNSHDEVLDILDYNRKMTETLFANQIYSYPLSERFNRKPSKPKEHKEVSQKVSSNSVVAVVKDTLDKRSLALDNIVKPAWHAPWKPYRIIRGKSAWVDIGMALSLAVDPANRWFVSGHKNGPIKVWNLADGVLKTTLTGHIQGVTGVAVSDRQTYLFSCGDDKKVICHDLETNQRIRYYHGHLSGVYCLAIHPSENVIVTGGRDSVARVWDMRTKEQIHCLTGHRDTVGSLLCLSGNGPSIITGSHDETIRLWDMRLGKTMTTLTNHKKSIRALALSHDKKSFASGAADNIKQWLLPEGKFIQNLSGHESIITSLAANDDNLLVSGSQDDGTMHFWDWRTGYNFQRLKAPIPPGTIEPEAGIAALVFDRSGSRLISADFDKTIKMYREDLEANEDTHPIEWRPKLGKLGKF